ncbi:ParB/RepB/Spo0J family partition protein [Syntrophomonas erecta subsp. sporosyntropha]
MPKKERGLGRGLDALLADTYVDEDKISQLEIELITPRPEQPRITFNQESLEELAQSLREHGMLQPVLVRTTEDGYELIAGERRWRAAQMAGMESIPAVIRDIDDREAAEIALIENLQRDDLNAIEEARAYRTIMDNYSYTQETLGVRVGKSRSHIANTLRILNLPDEIITMIEGGEIAAGHARPLLAIKNKQAQIEAAQKIAAGKWSVRQVEASLSGKNKTKPKKTTATKSVEIEEMEERLEQFFATKIRIIPKNRGKGGKIEISYYDEEDLDRILEVFENA